MALSKLGYALAFGAAVAGFAPANDYSPVSQAYAQELPTLANLDKCVTPQEIVQRANNEGQYLAVTADWEVGVAGKKVALRNIFSTDRSFSLGYRIGQNTGGNYCKVDTYKDVRILDAKGKEIDKRTQIPLNQIDTEGSIANQIMTGNKSGNNPIFQYTSHFAKSSEVARATVTGRIEGSGVLLVADNSGMVQDLTPFKNIKYTQSGEDLLAKAKSPSLAMAR